MWTVYKLLMDSLSPRTFLVLVLAAILAVSHGIAYQKGKEVIRTEQAEQRTALAQETLRLSELNRANEQSIQSKLQKDRAEYANAKKINLALADSLGQRLRDLQAELDNSEARADSAAGSGANGQGSIEYQLLGNCAGNLVALSTVAQKLADQVVGLQNYILSVQQ